MVSVRAEECDRLGVSAGIWYMDLSDGQLVARVRAGETDAYRGLVERYYGDCLRYATRTLGNDADAEEVVQDAFARAYRFLHRYDEEKRFKGWLFGIVINQCRTAASERQRRDGRLVSIDALPDAGVATPMPDELDPFLQRALMQLEPSHREALLLKYAEDWTYEEIADATGTRVSALKMRVKRAREQLIGLLGGAYDVT